ncbi:unnamed protein product [Moneuplotes crassus]|uniref:Uncharacterized protein n=1 Tax=Euplotes crassus TaxID=5936 RepID=A0AAD1XPV9_EUPCR|nr:unnamed protein product [Moneuplotes crassus]
MVIKCTDYKGCVRTKTMIRNSFFHNKEYNVSLPKRKENEKPAVEFCIPPDVLLGIIGSITTDDILLEFSYPVKDCLMQLLLKEEHFCGDTNQKIKGSTTVDFETYIPDEGMKQDFSITNENCVANIYACINIFKKALKELSFLDETTPVTLKFSVEYPHFQIAYNHNALEDNYFVIKFAADPGDVRYQIKSNISANYTIGSLRLAFSRYSKEDLSCALLISNEGFLCIKIVQENRDVYIETIVSNIDEGAELEMSQ